MLYIRIILKSGKEMDFSAVTGIRIGKTRVFIDYDVDSYFSVNVDSVAEIHSEFEKL